MLAIMYLNGNTEQLTKIVNRSVDQQQDIQAKTLDIINRIRAEGDSALRELTKQFDGAHFEGDEWIVTEAEYEAAFQTVDPELEQALQAAMANIKAYHEKQLTTGYELKSEGVHLQQVTQPIERVGIYVPGGKAAYPSTVLMNVVPAKLAGVADITIVTPPDKDGNVKPSLLVAAKLAGATRVVKIGGAQAIAALAYGTESIKKSDKITGPGNAFVAMAKRLVSGVVGIDMIAGPSEVVVLADASAHATYIVADMMAQAEHDEMASAIVITTCEKLAKEIVATAPEMVKKQARRDIIEKSFAEYGAVVVAPDLTAAIELVNTLAPEHLEIMTENAADVAKRIKHAGAIFLGNYTPEALGDYYAGSNHTLPTNATARFSSALSVTDFQKKMAIVHYDKPSLEKARQHIETIAEEEGLHAHRDSIRIRFEDA